MLLQSNVDHSAPAAGTTIFCQFAVLEAEMQLAYGDGNKRLQGTVG